MYQHICKCMCIYISAKNALSKTAQDTFFLKMRAVANSRDKESYEHAVNTLVASDVYTANSKLKKYVDTYWLSIPEVRKNMSFSPFNYNILLTII